MLKSPLRKLALRNLARAGYPPLLTFQHVACCSEYVRKTLQESGSIPDHAQVLYGGIDTEPYLDAVPRRNSDGPIRLLYFGRLIRDKGVHTAIEALGLLHARGELDQVHLTVLGSGHPEYVSSLRSRAASLGIAHLITFVDWVPVEEIPDRLKTHDIYLFTSLWPEPMARSVMEAMAAGLLVIGSEVGGQTEMFTPQNALTFQPGNAQELADNISTAIQNPDLRVALSIAGQEMVFKEFTLDRMTSEIEKFLHNI